MSRKRKGNDRGIDNTQAFDTIDPAMRIYHGIWIGFIAHWTYTWYDQYLSSQ